MAGPVGGVMFVTAESAKHLADLEHDLAHEHAELCAYQAAFAAVVSAATEAAFVHAVGAAPAYDVLRDLIDLIHHAAPGPSHSGSSS